MIGPITSLARATVSLGHIPRVSRRSRVVSTLKASTATSDFCPLNFTSLIVKIVEELEDRYIRNWSLSEKPLSVNQPVLQLKCSTEMALSVAVSLQVDTGRFPALYIY